VETVAPEGELLPDRAARKIAPTIVSDIDDRMKIAGEEIFGPVLVVKGYSRVTEAIDYINARPAPLVAYWYGPRRRRLPQLRRQYPQRGRCA
jgi:coniferyl-aldehyde dehydrogenase